MARMQGHWASSSSRLWGSLVFCLALPLLAEAPLNELPGAAPTRTESQGQPLDSAKKQFEDMEQARRNALVPASQVPTLDPSLASPPLPGKSPGLLPAPALLDPKKQPSSKEWLLDGVRRLEQEDRREAAASRATKRASDAKTVRDAEPSAAPGDVSEKASRFVIPSDFEKAKGDDPLRPYLSSWMAKDDYSLLVGDDLKSGASNSEMPFLKTLASDSALPSQIAHSAASGAESSVLPPNPYLKALEDSSITQKMPLAGSSGLQLPGDAMNPPPRPAPEVLAPPPPKPAEELKKRLQQDDDKKYFPQLKRF